MRLPGEKTWSPGVCEGLEGPKVGDRIFVRNRRHLIKSDDLVAKDVPEVEEATQPEWRDSPFAGVCSKPS